MRSLYTSDIQGTTSRRTIFEKGYYKNKLDEQIRRDAKKTQRNMEYEWYLPEPKPQKVVYQRDPYKNTLKLISQQTGISRLVHQRNQQKRNQYTDHQRYRNYSLLGHSGVSILNQSHEAAQKNPYYPHKIRDSQDRSYSTRFTGNRSWNSDPNSQIKLPDPKSQYISKWIKL